MVLGPCFLFPMEVDVYKCHWCVLRIKDCYIPPCWYISLYAGSRHCSVERSRKF